MDTVLEKLNHASKREFQRSRPCQSAISKEDVLFPLKISLDRENSMVEVKTVIGKGFYLNEPRFSNIFIEKRGSSYLQSLVLSGLFYFADWRHTQKNSQNAE